MNTYLKGYLFNIFLKAIKFNCSTKNYCRDHSTFSETKLWNIGENYKIKSMHQDTSIHRGRSRNFGSRFSIVVDPKCRGLGTQPPAADKVWFHRHEILNGYVFTVPGLANNSCKWNIATYMVYR